MIKELELSKTSRLTTSTAPAGIKLKALEYRVNKEGNLEIVFLSQKPSRANRLEITAADLPLFRAALQGHKLTKK